MAPLSHVTYHILLALAQQDNHGYGIIKGVADRTRGQVELEAGTLYAAIKRLKDGGLIAEAPAAQGADPRRRNYTITKVGRRVLLAESRRLLAMVELAWDANVLPTPRPSRA